MPPATDEVPFDQLPTSDRPRTKARARRAAEEARGHHDAGYQGRGFSYGYDDELDQEEARYHYARGRTKRSAERRAEDDAPSSDAPADDEPVPTHEAPPPPAPTPRAAAPRRARSYGAPHAINDGAGFLLGLIGYALFINFLRGGPEQVRGWLSAKFLNRPYGQAPSGLHLPGTPATSASAASTLTVLGKDLYVAPPGAVGAALGAGAHQ